MKKPALVISFLCIIILFLSVVQVVVSSKLSTTGVVLGNLDDAINAYKKNNEVLSEKLLSASSYSHIASAAATIGFVSTKSHVYLTSPLPLAIRQ